MELVKCLKESGKIEIIENKQKTQKILKNEIHINNLNYMEFENTQGFQSNSEFVGEIFGVDYAEMLKNAKNLEWYEKLRIPKMAQENKNTRKKINVLNGGNLAIPKYLTGDPLHFSRKENKKIRKETVNLCINVLGEVSAEEYNRKIHEFAIVLKYLLNNIDILNLNICKFSSIYNSNDKNITSVLNVVKVIEEGKFSNTQSIIGIFDNVAFYRKLLFSIFENVTKNYSCFCSSFGSSIKDPAHYIKIHKFTNDFLNTHFISIYEIFENNPENVIIKFEKNEFLIK